MREDDDKAVALRFLELVNRGMAEPADAMITPAALDAVRRALAPFDEIRIVPDRLVADGDVVFCQARLRGRHVAALAGVPATGRIVEVAVAQVFRIDRGRIADSWLSWDAGELLRQLAPGPEPEPVLEADEIQGNIMPGFSKDHQTLIMLDIVEAAGARRWLAQLTPHVATLREVHEFKRLFERTRRRRSGEGAVTATWLNVALSAGGLAKLGADPAAFTDGAFRAGMASRATVLGDPVDPLAPGHASRWRFGGTASGPDVLLIIAGDDPERVARETARQLAGAAPALRVAFQRRGAVLPPPLTGREAFGYTDGVSQPRPRGQLSPRPGDYLTPRDANSDIAAEPRGTGLVWPGEFVFGYPSEGPTGAAGPASSGGPTWTRNGSFVVVRHYRQDVGRFDAFLRDTAARLAREVPALRALTAARLGAMMFGRWRSGAPLALAAERDAPELGADDTRNNQFSFSEAALPCPYAAHIRRANPRDDRGVDPVQQHRLLRRGIPYVDGAERGLVFIAYMASIERQFEFLVRAWINNPDLGAPGAGVDPILGVTPAGRPFRVPVTGSGDGPLLMLPEWVTPTGGGYFFAPSISALMQLAAR